MNEEELNRKMEFIVEQQTQFAVDIQKLQEAQAELAIKHNHLTDALTTVVGMVGKLAQSQETFSQDVSKKFAELATKQAETDERLNIFINVVERYISEKRNGNSTEGS